MRALLDVNVLIALLDKSHTHHLVVSAWFVDNVTPEGWASCALTQNGTVRIIGNKGYPNPQPPQATIAKLAAFCATPLHAFWPDGVSLLDPTLFDPSVALTSGQLTDVYLLGLAVRNGGKFVTIDKGVVRNGVIGSRAENLEVIAVPP